METEERIDAQAPTPPMQGASTAVSQLNLGPPTRAFGCTGRDLGIASLVILLTVAFATGLSYPAWTPRMALVLAGLPAGMVALFLQSRAGSVAARLGLATSVWVVITALLSGAVRSSLVGFVGRDLSAVVVVAAVAMWALGRTVSPRGADVAIAVAVAGLSVSGFVGLIQVLADVETGVFALNGGRPSGLATNPVYFGGACVAGAAIAARRWIDDRRNAWLLAGAWLVMGVLLSGSRVAFLALPFITIALVARFRRDAVWPVAAGAVGLAAGFVIDAVAGQGRNAVVRSTGSVGMDGRRQVWGFAMEALTERPLHGWGFGRFQAAVQDEYTPEFVRDYATLDIGQAWFDAHNIFVTVLVATGVIGLVLFVAWAWSAGRFARGPAAWGVAAMALTWMLQPASLATLPLTMLLFGVATRLDTDDPAAPLLSDDEPGEDDRPEPAPDATLPAFPPRRVGATVAAGLGVVLGLALLAADLNLYVATEALDAERSEAAAQWFPGDPVVASVVGQVWAIETEDPLDQRSLDWWQQAVDRDPSRPYWWTLLAVRQMIAGDLEQADETLSEALRLQPTHYLARKIDVQLSARLRDEDRLREAVARACEVGAPECDTDIEAALEPTP